MGQRQCSFPDHHTYRNEWYPNELESIFKSLRYQVCSEQYDDDAQDLNGFQNLFEDQPSHDNNDDITDVRRNDVGNCQTIRDRQNLVYQITKHCITSYTYR